MGETFWTRILIPEGKHAGTYFAPSWAETSGEALEHVRANTSMGDAALFGPTVPTAAHEPCASCEWQTLCMDSRWNCGRRAPAAPHEMKDAPLRLGDVTSVHTCKTCGEKVIGLWEEEKAQVVPDDCPRWDSLHGSAIDCGGCRVEKEALRKRHPLDATKTEAAVAIFEGILNSLKAGSTKEDSISLASEAFVKASAPLSWAKSTEPHLALAQRLLGILWADIQSREEFTSDWERNNIPKERIDHTTFEMFDHLLLSLRFHGKEPERVAHDFVLFVTDRPVISRGWVWCRREGQLKLRARWLHLIRSEMGPGEAVQ